MDPKLYSKRANPKHPQLLSAPKCGARPHSLQEDGSSTCAELLGDLERFQHHQCSYSLELERVHMGGAFLFPQSHRVP